MRRREVLAYAYQIPIADSELDLLQRKLDLKQGVEWNGVALNVMEDTISHWRDYYS